MASANLIILTGQVVEIREGCFVLKTEDHPKQQKDVINCFLIASINSYKAPKIDLKEKDIVSVEGRLSNVFKDLPGGKGYNQTIILAEKVERLFND